MSYVDTDQFKDYYYNHIMQVEEPICLYRPGGYHPVALGDQLQDGRYTIRHKLGFGAFSTVWLALDNIRQIWVALKIMKANASFRESCNLRHIVEKAECNLAPHHIVQVLDHFGHQGPNGLHQCIAMELVGPTLKTFFTMRRGTGGALLDIPTLYELSIQLLKAISWLHSVEVCHGDITCSDIAFVCPHLWHATDIQCFDAMGAPEVEAVIRTDGMPLPDGIPLCYIKSAPWLVDVDASTREIRLFDFGGSRAQAHHAPKLNQPIPEMIFTNNHDCSIDSWLAGSVIYQFLSLHQPFAYFQSNAHSVVYLMNMLGDLPDEWQALWKAQNGPAESYQHLQKDPGPSQLETLQNTSHPSFVPIISIIRGLMRFAPLSRITPREALSFLETSYEQWLNSDTTIVANNVSDI